MSGRQLGDSARTHLIGRLDDLAASGVSGTVLLAEAGTPVVQHCLGLADRANGVPITPRTRFQTASVTKMFTAAAVLDQVARGRVTVHTPVVDVVPSDRRPRHLSTDVTVHHLLCHTSGIADYCEEDESLPAYCADYGALWRALPPARVERPADFLTLYGELPAYCPPGQIWRYSNAGYVLLGELLEQLTGQPCATVIEQRVLRRAGMTASAFDRSDEPRADSATHYRPSGRTNVHSVPVIGGSDGGCVCTAADLVRFCRALADGTLLGELTTSATQRQAAIEDGWSYGYGLYVYPDERWGHGGGDPGVSAIVNHWPEGDLTLVALCNVEEVDGRNPAVALRDAVLAVMSEDPSGPGRAG
ncbi:serine hydrolase domain-containing protein [Nakamurella sp.]|uniref:serine hydrolase domain-containing protein n=1 Tax=Nakamurella sp. TaxID=1869182 RepID=UPI003782D3FD